MLLSDYRRAASIARRAVAHRGLSPDDLEDVCQEAAIAAWRHGLDPATPVGYAAIDAADRIQQTRRVARIIPVADPPVATIVDPEAEAVAHLTFDRLLAVLSTSEQNMVRAIIAGYTQAEIGRAYGMHDSNVGRHWHAALDKMRAHVST